MADGLLHEEGAPFTISPFVVDAPRLFVEEGGEEEDFREGICNNFEERFTGDTVELVGEVKQDRPRGKVGCLLIGGGRYIFPPVIALC